MFQYTANDEFTCLRYLGAYEEQSTYSYADFLQKTTAWFSRKGIAKAERSHREDQRRLYNTHSICSLNDFASQRQKHLCRSNDFPIRPLHWQSQMEFLSAYAAQDV